MTAMTEETAHQLMGHVTATQGGKERAVKQVSHCISSTNNGNTMWSFHSPKQGVQLACGERIAWKFVCVQTVQAVIM